MSDEALAARAGLPWPQGDPAALRGAGRGMAAAEEALAAAAQRLSPMSAADADWVGGSAMAFEAAVGAEGSAITSAAAGLARAADALTRLADAVDDAQATVGDWARRVIAAQDAAAADPTGDSDGDLATLRASAISAAADAVDAATRADAAAADAVSSVRAPLGGTGPMPSPPATPLAMAVGGAYAPLYRFDGGEDHHPGDVEAWIANAGLKQRADGTWYLDPEGEDIRNGDLDSATLPVTYHVTDDGELQLEYGLFYPFNDFPDAPTTGVDHEGDFEPFTVQFGRDGRPEAADFESHGHTRVRPWEDVEVTVEGRPVVYPSHGGHGNNPEPGRYDNDFTEGDTAGPDWITNRWRDDADGQGAEWDSAPAVVDANAIPGLRGDGDFASANFGEDKDQGRGNPQSFLDPDQGPPPDLDGDDDDPAAQPGGPYPEPAD